MVKEETHGNIYPNAHILDILASSKSYKEVVVRNTHWKFMDSEYFRGGKAIQSLGHPTRIRLWHSNRYSWMSVTAQHSPGIQGAFGSRGHDGILSQDRKGWEFCYHFISDWWMLVRSICLLCWKLMRSQTPGVYIDPFTRLCHSWLFCEYQACCLRLGIAVWQEGPWSACWLPQTHRHTDIPNTPGKCPVSCSSSTETMLHSDKEVTPATEPLLPRQGHTCEETISISLLSSIQAMTWLNSPQHTYQHPCCFIWGGWLRSMPPANSRVRHCTASPELAQVGMCSKLEAQLQWHLTNDPMQGALLLFPGPYPDW